MTSMFRPFFNKELRHEEVTHFSIPGPIMGRAPWTVVGLEAR